ncbi:hypothetical protein K458DRAFT_286283 [Lentithecium fluviatile CBS 122367]|uniref:RBR-type E3 ubiquitin transferase n=1 Tax=Lentithecium fluviatile CBS 122367 TaxID=1168545 RepID=A0A6G1JNC4_9PLEO|nr:hypothetical protein K458DRAFT_286283 [Lentithecium fluviatile CBS 122367]
MTLVEEDEFQILVEDSGNEDASFQRVNAARGKQAQQRSQARELECIVCGETVPTPDLPYLVSCTHEPQTCRDCFAAWIGSELENKDWQSIKCPGSDCRVILAHEEVKQYATKEVFEKFDSYAVRAALGDDPNFRWCRAQGCNSGQVHLSGEDSNIFRCVACGHRVCVIHNDTFHEGETCQEFDYRTSGQKERDQRKQEEASERAIGKLTKKCPGKGCSFNIQKNGGCDHMTCSRCHYEFCWECLADYNKIRRRGNGAHKRSCKYHSDRMPDLDTE